MKNGNEMSVHARPIIKKGNIYGEKRHVISHLDLRTSQPFVFVYYKISLSEVSQSIEEQESSVLKIYKI